MTSDDRQRVRASDDRQRVRASDDRQRVRADTQINQIIDEHFQLLWAVLDRCKGSPQYDDLEKHATIAITFNEGCIPYWRRLAVWALSDDGLPDDIREIARRMFNCYHRTAAHLGLDIYPTDCEDALERARAELKPFLNKGEVQ